MNFNAATALDYTPPAVGRGLYHVQITQAEGKVFPSSGRFGINFNFQVFEPRSDNAVMVTAEDKIDGDGNLLCKDNGQPEVIWVESEENPVGEFIRFTLFFPKYEDEDATKFAEDENVSYANRQLNLIKTLLHALADDIEIKKTTNITSEEFINLLPGREVIVNMADPSIWRKNKETDDYERQEYPQYNVNSFKKLA